MGIFDRFRREAPSPEAAPGRIEPQVSIPDQQPRAYGEIEGFDGLKDPRLAMFMRDGPLTASGVHVTSDTAMRIGAVYGSIRTIAGAVATMPLDIKRRDGRFRLDAEEHPLWDIIRRRPNRWMKPAQFRRMLQAHLLLRGNAYAMIVRGGRGQVTALLPMHPDQVSVTQNSDMSLAYEYHTDKGKKLDLEQSEVFHLTGMTLDGIRGVSVITYARESMGLAIATANHGASFFRNGTHVGSILEHPGKLSQAATDNLREELNKFRAGSDRSRASMILQEGMKFHNLAMTAEDAQFVETLKMTRTDIGMFFGVPPHMLGDTEKSTSWGSGIEAQARGFVAFTLEDWLVCWEEAINADLIADSERQFYARFNRAALVRGDFKTRWDGYKSGMQFGVYSPDDIRAMEDENPRPDGQGGVYYDPPNTAGTPASEGTGDDDSEAA